MSSVWKRLQRVNKKASKFSFIASFQEVVVESKTKWHPSALRVVWTRKSRKHTTQTLSWEPMISNTSRGSAVWPFPENIEVSVTLFSDPKINDFECKNWTFTVEEVLKSGKSCRIASAKLNMALYAGVSSQQKDVKLNLKPLTKDVSEVVLRLTISSKLIKEGKATDEDMMSLASLMSSSSTSSNDVANLEDFEESSLNTSDTSAKISEIASQFDLLTKSVMSQPVDEILIKKSLILNLPAAENIGEEINSDFEDNLDDERLEIGRNRLLAEEKEVFETIVEESK